MPGIGSLIREIDVKISEMSETNILILLSKTNARILSVNTNTNLHTRSIIVIVITPFTNYIIIFYYTCTSLIIEFTNLPCCCINTCYSRLAVQFQSCNCNQQPISKHYYCMWMCYCCAHTHQQTKCLSGGFKKKMFLTIYFYFLFY